MKSTAISRTWLIGRWLLEPWHLWLTIAVICVALVISINAKTEPVIRITGGMLQLSGILTIIWGINSTRKFFGKPGFLRSGQNWLRRFPRSRNVTGTGSATIGLSGSGYGYGTIRARPGASVEERIDALEQNVERIQETASRLNQLIDNNERRLRETINIESAARKQGDQDIEKKLEGFATGGFSITAAGAAWLFVGTILGTAAPEIHKFLG